MSDRAVKADAARAGVSAEEYLERTRVGTLYCYRCQDWHDASEFGPDKRRPGGKATSCLRSVSAARQALLRRELGDLAARPAGTPAPADSHWIAVVRQAQADARDPGRDMYWTGPDGDSGPSWTTSLGEAARFPTVEALRDALMAAYSGSGHVPSGCRLARISR